MSEINYQLLLFFIAWNLLTFILYGIDKYNAIKGKWRYPNKTLLSCAFFFGGIGALLGMYSFRHKTQTRSFIVLVPIGAILSALLGYYFIAM